MKKIKANPAVLEQARGNRIAARVQALPLEERIALIRRLYEHAEARRILRAEAELARALDAAADG